MATPFLPSKIDINTINSGNRFEPGDGVTPDAINGPIEAAAYAQEQADRVVSLATLEPDVSEVAQVGTPTVSIEETANGPRFKFSKLKGEPGTDHAQDIEMVRVEQDEQDRGIEANRREIHNIKQALLQNEVLVVSKIENKTTTRVTAGGENIVDDQYTPVNEIKGSTVKFENLLSLGSVDLNGTVNPIPPIPLDLKGTYTFSFKGNISSVERPSAALVSIKVDGSPVYITVTLTNGKQSNTVTGHITEIDFINWCNAVGSITEIMLNKGDTALPYQPYFTDLKHAFIKSIKSTGRNLFDSSLLLKANGWTESNGVYRGNAQALHAIFNRANGGILGTLNTDKQMTVSFSARNLSIGGSLGKTAAVYFDYTDGTQSEILVSGISEDFSRYTLTSIVGKTIKMIHISYANGGEMELKELCVKYGDDTNYEPYTEELYELPETLELGEWDSFNPQTGEITRQARRLVIDGVNFKLNIQDMNTYWLGLSYLGAYNGEAQNQVIANNGFSIGSFNSSKSKGMYLTNTGNTHIAVWFNKTLFTEADVSTDDKLNAYLKSLADAGTPLTVDYKLATPTIERIEDVPKQYTAWNKGSETVIQGETDNSIYGAMPTVTNEYILKIGGEE